MRVIQYLHTNIIGWKREVRKGGTRGGKSFQAGEKQQHQQQRKSQSIFRCGDVKKGGGREG